MNTPTHSFAWRNLAFMCVVAVVTAVSLVFGVQATAQADEPDRDTVYSFPVAREATGLNQDKEPGYCSLYKDTTVVPLENDLPRMGSTPCVGGTAGGFQCSNVDLHAYFPRADLLPPGSPSRNASSLWGWTDPVTGREYALIGMTDRTTFVDITDGGNSFVIGWLPSHTGTSSWRELKSYNNHAFIVADNNGAHGIQIFDLTQLRSYQTPPDPKITFTETAHYGGADEIHNIWINAETGYAYPVGGDYMCPEGGAVGGIQFVNVQNPLSPTYEGCFGLDGYTHDVDCLVYDGPDQDYQGREICVASNTDTITIVDVTDKANPFQISRTGYTGSGYTHQSSFTADLNYMVVDDELDETGSSHNARTYVWNMQDLDAPVLIDYDESPLPNIDHNQYIHNGFLYQANYTAGLRVQDISDIANANLTEIGYFDIVPATNGASFNGAWNVYPFFDSGSVIVSGIGQGLFVLYPTNLNPPTAVTVSTLSSTGATDGILPLATGVALMVLAGIGVTRRLKKQE